MLLWIGFFLDQVDQHLYGPSAKAFGGLGNGRQRWIAVRGHWNIVESGERNILRHTQPLLFDSLERADGHFVIFTKQRARSAVERE